MSEENTTLAELARGTADPAARLGTVAPATGGDELCNDIADTPQAEGIQIIRREEWEED